MKSPCRPRKETTEYLSQHLTNMGDADMISTNYIYMHFSGHIPVFIRRCYPLGMEYVVLQPINTIFWFHWEACWGNTTPNSHLSGGKLRIITFLYGNQTSGRRAEDNIHGKRWQVGTQLFSSDVNRNYIILFVEIPRYWLLIIDHSKDIFIAMQPAQHGFNNTSYRVKYIWYDMLHEPSILLLYILNKVIQCVILIYPERHPGSINHGKNVFATNLSTMAQLRK